MAKVLKQLGANPG